MRAMPRACAARPTGSARRGSRKASKAWLTGRSQSGPLLATTSRTRNFGGLAAVRDVSIRLHEGELHAVIGPNGSVKSPLVNLLSLPPAPIERHDRCSIAPRHWRALVAHDAARRLPFRFGAPTSCLPSQSWRMCFSRSRRSQPAAGELARRPSRPRFTEAARAAPVLAPVSPGRRKQSRSSLSHGAQRQLEIA